MRRLTIIIPTLNEAATIASALTALAPLRARGAEVIVVDGGSADDTPRLAAPLADHVSAASRGRALSLDSSLNVPESCRSSAHASCAKEEVVA